MGCGHTTQRDKIVTPHKIGKFNLKYPSHMKLRIKVKDSAGNETGGRTVAFDLKAPFIHAAPQSKFELVEHVSLCTLPGCDPAGTTEKKCQDICGVFSTPSAILLALFDGHGKDGEKIVDVCLQETKKLFEASFEASKSNIKEFLETICRTCDDSVKKNPGMDSNNSGR